MLAQRGPKAAQPRKAPPEQGCWAQAGWGWRLPSGQLRGIGSRSPENQAVRPTGAKLGGPELDFDHEPARPVLPPR